jgi:hypothetical protein
VKDIAMMSMRGGTHFFLCQMGHFMDVLRRMHKLEGCRHQQ